MPEQSILDARLAEIDRRLRTIQSGLTPDEPAQAPAPDAPPTSAEPRTPPEPRTSPEPRTWPEPRTSPEPRRPTALAPATPPSSLRAELGELAQLVSELRDLTAAHERLLTSSRELLSAVADTLVRSQSPAAPPAASPAVPPGTTTISLTAGPFPDTLALRRFERSLSSLPEVAGVDVREYAGEDRVVVDVHLAGPTS